MAGTEKLKERILSEARKKADSDIEAASREAEAILNRARGEASEKKAAILSKAEKEAAANEKRLVSVAELESRKAVLAAKQEIIAELFSKAVEKLNLLSDAEYEKALVGMIIESATGNEEVLLSKRDLPRVSADFIGKANRALTSAGKRGSLTLSAEPGLINGGFVLKSGDIEVNNSFESIIASQKDSLEALAVKMLF